jgi:hypothetical protein
MINPLNNIIRTAPMAACAKVQFDLIAEIQRQRAQFAKWDIDAKYMELQAKIHAADKKDYNSRSIKLALERHYRK